MDREVQIPSEGSESPSLDGCGISENERSRLVRSGSDLRRSPTNTHSSKIPSLNRREEESISFIEHQNRHARHHRASRNRFDRKGHHGTFHIRVKSNMGLACRVRVCDMDKVGAVMLTVSSFTGVPPSRIQLVLRKTGMELTNANLTMKEAGITDGDLLYLVPKVKAGPLSGYTTIIFVPELPCPVITKARESTNSSVSQTSINNNNNNINNNSNNNHSNRNVAQLSGIPVIARQLLEKRLRKLDETQDELDRVSCLNNSDKSSMEDCAGMGDQVEVVKHTVLEERNNDGNDDEGHMREIEKARENDITRKRMLDLRARLMMQKNSKRRKLCLV